MRFSTTGVDPTFGAQLIIADHKTGIAGDQQGKYIMDKVTQKKV